MFKFKNTKPCIKIIIIILISIVTFYGVIALYSLVFEKDKLAIDAYNFEQLEKAKPTLNKVKSSDIFRNLNEFNNLYKVEIKPIKNCYHVRGQNGDYPYIFGFQLESLIYKFIYFSNKYAYPSYDLPKDSICMGDGGGGCISDVNYNSFINIISNPCKD